MAKVWKAEPEALDIDGEFKILSELVKDALVEILDVEELDDLDTAAFHNIVQDTIEKSLPGIEDINEIASDFARNRAAALVSDISGRTRSSIQKIIARGIDEGMTDDQIASLIKNRVGLTETQSERVDKFREAMIKSGVPKGKAATMAKKFAKTIISQRAETIAKTEVQLALNAAQHIAWQDAVLEGEIPKSAERKLVVHKDERNCPTCRPLHGKTVSLFRGEYKTKIGKSFMPPFHPNCRCSEVLVLDGKIVKHLPGLHDQSTHGRRGHRARVMQWQRGYERRQASVRERREILGRKPKPGKKDKADFLKLTSKRKHDVEETKKKYKIRRTWVSPGNASDKLLTDMFTVQHGKLKSVPDEPYFYKHDNRWGIEGNIWDGNKVVGRFERFVEKDEVEHAYLRVNKEYQGQGFAEAFNTHAENFYAALGIKTITVHANIDVGGYAWARKGFDFNDEDREHIVDVLHRFVVKGLWNDAEMPDDIVDEIARLGTNPTAWEVSELGRDSKARFWSYSQSEEASDAWRYDVAPPKKTFHFGKAFLLGMDWYGKKDLTPLIEFVSKSDNNRADVLFEIGERHREWVKQQKTEMKEIRSDDSDYNLHHFDVDLVGPDCSDLLAWLEDDEEDEEIEKHGTKGTPGYKLLHPGRGSSPKATPKKRVPRRRKLRNLGEKVTWETPKPQDVLDLEKEHKAKLVKILADEPPSFNIFDEDKNAAKIKKKAQAVSVEALIAADADLDDVFERRNRSVIEVFPNTSKQYTKAQLKSLMSTPGNFVYFSEPKEYEHEDEVMHDDVSVSVVDVEKLVDKLLSLQDDTDYLDAAVWADDAIVPDLNVTRSQQMAYRTAIRSGTPTRDKLRAELRKLLSYDSGYVPSGPKAEAELKNRRIDRLSRSMIHQWAETSNNNSDTSLALQEVAADEFKLENTAPWQMRPEAIKRAVARVVKNRGDILHPFLRGMYEATQKHFAKQNVKSIKIYRGVMFDEDYPSFVEGKKDGDEVEISLRPMSSWATSLSSAMEFVAFHGNRSGAILEMDVPAAQILSVPATGFGCLHEREVVILGGKVKAKLHQVHSRHVPQAHYGGKKELIAVAKKITAAFKNPKDGKKLKIPGYGTLIWEQGEDGKIWLYAQDSQFNALKAWSPNKVGDVWVPTLNWNDVVKWLVIHKKPEPEPESKPKQKSKTKAEKAAEILAMSNQIPNSFKDNPKPGKKFNISGYGSLMWDTVSKIGGGTDTYLTVVTPQGIKTWWVTGGSPKLNWDRVAEFLLDFDEDDWMA